MSSHLAVPECSAQAMSSLRHHAGLPRKILELPHIPLYPPCAIPFTMHTQAASQNQHTEEKDPKWLGLIPATGAYWDSVRCDKDESRGCTYVDSCVVRYRQDGAEKGEFPPWGAIIITGVLLLIAVVWWAIAYKMGNYCKFVMKREPRLRSKESAFSGTRPTNCFKQAIHFCCLGRTKNWNVEDQKQLDEALCVCVLLEFWIFLGYKLFFINVTCTRRFNNCR